MLTKLDILTASRFIKTKELSPVDLVKTSLDKISENPKVNVFITVCEAEAVGAAKALEQEVIDGKIRGDSDLGLRFQKSVFTPLTSCFIGADIRGKTASIPSYYFDSI